MATCSSADSVLEAAELIKANGVKLNTFVNGTSSESVQLGASGDPATPTIRHFMADLQDAVALAANDAAQTVLDTVSANESAIEALRLDKADAPAAAAPELEVGNYNTSTGSPSSVATSAWLRTANYYPVTAGRVYAVDFDDLTSTQGEVPIRVDIHFYDASKTWLSCAVNRIFAAAPDSARYVRLCFQHSADASAGSSPFAEVADVASRERSASFPEKKQTVSLRWHKGFIGRSSAIVDVGGAGQDGFYRYALAFVSKGDLIWLKAGQSANQSIIASINASTGAMTQKVVNDGESRDNWLDHMWVADQDTCVVLSNNTYWKSEPECVIYPNFLYSGDTFNDAGLKKAGYPDKTTGFCSNAAEEYDESSEVFVYASSQMICLKKGQYISSASGAYSSVYAITAYDSANHIVPAKSVEGRATTDVCFYGLRCTDDYLFVRISGRLLENDSHGVPKFMEYSVRNAGALTGKSLAMLGDSYVGPYTATSYPRAAYNLGMSYATYGISGNTISAYQENGMVNRYTEMADGFDYVGLVGGRNDYNNSVTIGALDSTDTSTFCGALNVLCEGLIKKYIGKKLFAVTSWNVNDGQNAYNDAFVAVVSGRWNIPVLQTYKGANVYMKVAEFRQAYCIADNDVSHLNILGHMNIMTSTIESFIKSL